MHLISFKPGRTSLMLTVFAVISLLACQKRNQTVNTPDFPDELVRFTPDTANPVFAGTDTNTWDQHIRERGYILFEDSLYKMWYTGYRGGNDDPKSLGYATSPDGIHWTRYAGNPIFSEKWTEDMFVCHIRGTYYMVAEGRNDIAHLLTSTDGLGWKEKGDLILLDSRGDTIEGPYGTPCLWVENEKWYLFYERNDEAIWLATSADLITWKNIQDAPVLTCGPGVYDSGAVAANQVIRYKNTYYMYYHGSADSSWAAPGATSEWNSNVAASTDLIHWTKYPNNPVVAGDHSSPITVFAGGTFYLYTMHDIVWRYNPGLGAGGN
jgi:beta-1,2-mannobiose phosphorylase / 1,2-beta-oligomannan phosphorylase